MTSLITDTNSEHLLRHIPFSEGQHAYLRISPSRDDFNDNIIKLFTKPIAEGKVLDSMNQKYGFPVLNVLFFFLTISTTPAELHTLRCAVIVRNGVPVFFPYD